MQISEITEELYLVDLDQSLTGFRKFIGCWIYKGKELTFLVDPGPSASIGQLKKAIRELKLTKVDYILLTHIHIDHAGGSGLLLKDFPNARVICHPKGISHMIDPEKLWKGSLKVLGKVAEAYGPIEPISEKSIQFQHSLDTSEGTITVIDTPGHAVHHQSYLFKNLFFAGEVAGVQYQSENGIYKRPATPPVFKLEVSKDSLEKIEDLNPDFFCFGHYGYSRDIDQVIADAKTQLDIWVNISRQELESGEENLIERVIDRLKTEDKHFQLFSMLPADIMTREGNFVKNSVNGMIDYVRSSL